MTDNVIDARRRFNQASDIEEAAKAVLDMNQDGDNPIMDVFAEEHQVSDNLAIHYFTFTRAKTAGVRGFYSIVQKTDRGWSQAAVSDLFMAEDATLTYGLMELAVLADAEKALDRAPVLDDLAEQIQLAANPRSRPPRRNPGHGPDAATDQVAQNEAQAILNMVTSTFDSLMSSVGASEKDRENAIVRAAEAKSFIAGKSDEFAAVDLKLSIDGKGYSYTQLVYGKILSAMPGAGDDRAQDFESFREEFSEKVNDVLKLDLSDKSNKKNVKAILYL